MSNDENSGMVEVGLSPDFRTWMCVDQNDRYYGWIFYKHPDGQFVTLRNSTDCERFTVLRSLPAITVKSRVDAACEPMGERVFATPDCLAFWKSEDAQNSRAFAGMASKSETYEVCPGIKGAWMVVPTTLPVSEVES